MFLTIAELTGRNKISRPFASSSGQRNPVVLRERVSVQADPTIEAAPTVELDSRQPLLDSVGASGFVFARSSSGVPNGMAVRALRKPAPVVFFVPFSVGGVPLSGSLPARFGISYSLVLYSLALFFWIAPISSAPQFISSFWIVSEPLAVFRQFVFAVFSIPTLLIFSSFCCISKRHCRRV